MVKRIMSLCVTLGLMFLSGIVIYSLPTAATFQLARAQAAAPANPSVAWVIDGGDEESRNQANARLVALDTQTGELLLQVPSYFAYQPTSRDGNWKFATNLQIPPIPSENILVTQLDMRRGQVARIFSFAPALYDSTGSLLLYRGVVSQLVVAPDNLRVAVVVGSVFGGNLYMQLGLLDAATGDTFGYTGMYLTDAGVADSPSAQPFLWASFIDDGNKLLVMQSAAHDASGANASTKVMVFNLGANARSDIVLESSRNLTMQIKLDGQALLPMIFSDGKMLYLLQFDSENGNSSSYRFLSFDVAQGQVVRTAQVTAGHGEPFCTNEVRLSPDGKYLYGYCYGQGTPPNDEFRFLATQTGLVTKQVTLPVDMTINPSGNFSWDHILSRDAKEIYVVGASETQMEAGVLDVAQQAFVRHAVLTPKTTGLNWLEELRKLFVNTASAKGGEGESFSSIVLNPDGKRMYFTAPYYRDELHRAVLAVDTNSLQLAGQWLKGLSISGLSLNADGTELYAASPANHTVYVLDARTGQILRALDKGLKSPSGFAQ